MPSMSIDKYLDVKKGVIHIGAHEGQEREWYRSLGFGYVLWFEPNMEVYNRLVENLKNYRNNKAYNLGIHDFLNVGILHISSNDGLSSSILNLGLHQKYRPDIGYIKDQMITLIRMDDFVKEKKINIGNYNFLNIDVQGTELNVLRSFGGLLDRFDYIKVEVNITE